MKNDLIHRVFADFCETHSHLDFILSEIEPTQKRRVALVLGAFLRRPFVLAHFFKIDLGTPEEFWSQSFIRLRRNTQVHDVLEEVWKKYKTYSELPQEGGIFDFPPSMIQEWTEDWGEASARDFAKNLSQDPLTTIRLHRRARENEERLVEVLKEFELPKMRKGHYSPFARIFKGFARVQTNPLFKTGWYEIQDEGSQIMSLYTLFPEAVAPLLSSTPTVFRTKFPEIDFEKMLHSVKFQTVVDACAGAGGKTLALADFLGGSSRIYGYDIFERKISALKRRAERSGDRNIQAKLFQANEIKGYRESADRVLIDSPCTGLGVLRRNPDIKWNRKPLPQKQPTVPMQELQRSIIQSYLPLVKVGGVLIYGVCSFSKRETLDQVEWIQKNGDGLELINSGFIGPHETDGFFMAAFIKKAGR